MGTNHRGDMAVRCDRCGNFIQNGLIDCPVCGAGMEPDHEPEPRSEPGKLFQIGRDTWRRGYREPFSVNPGEAFLLKIIAGLLFAILGMTVFLPF